MKRYLIMLLLLISVFTITINASEKTDNVLKFQKSKSEYNTSASVACISISSLGNVAIGFKDKHINVYDNTGNYLYGFSFDFNGSYVFEFDQDDNIVIYPARGEERYYYSSDGELKQVTKFHSTLESDKYYRKLLQTKEFTINNKTYELKQSFANTKIIQSDENGNQKIIYERSDYIGKLTQILFVLVFVVIVSVIVVRTILNEVKKYRHNKL